MNEQTIEKLISNATGLKKFLSLPQEDQKSLFPLLGKAERTAISVLEVVASHNGITYKEISKILGIHAETVSQILNALSIGGLIINQGLTKQWISTKGGAPTKVIGKKDDPLKDFIGAVSIGDRSDWASEEEEITFSTMIEREIEEYRYDR